MMLLSACLPYAVGLIALAGNTEPTRCGPWLEWMALGLLYASASALGFLGLGLRTSIRTRTEKARLQVSDGGSGWVT